MYTDDTIQNWLLMGPHARASYNSRVQALKEYGINPEAIHISDDNHHIAQAVRYQREFILNNEIDTIAH